VLDDIKHLSDEHTNEHIVRQPAAKVASSYPQSASNK